jgi:hypothetical protein
LLMGCLPEADKIPQKKEDIKIVSGNLGKEQFFIPKAYFKEGTDGFEGGDISLQMMQPDFLPLLKSSDQIFKDGEKEKIIRILANENRGIEINYSKHIQERISFFKAFEKVDSEYGLTHFTQPNGYVKDWQDVWVEHKGNQNISYIYCHDDNPNLFPQCTHSFEMGTIYVQVHYDKRNLPKWKKIQTGVLETFDSFKSIETAKEELFKKYSNIKNHGE